MKLIFSIFLFATVSLKAQVPDSIYVNLYTDSLRKGTFNYINIDGMMQGRYFPLDSTHLVFESSCGWFKGNSLWIPEETSVKKIKIKATLRNNPSVFREFVIYIKQEEDPPLKTEEELLNEMKTKSKTKIKKKSS